MKKLLMMVVVLVTAAALFTSCGSGNPDEGGNGDGSNGTSSSGSGSGGSGSGGSGSGGSGGSSGTTINVPKIFDMSALTTDCTQEEFEAFFDTAGDYECQYIFSNSDFYGSALSETIYSTKAEYTITTELFSAPETEFTNASETVYVEIVDSTHKDMIQTSYEDEGYTVTFNGNIATCTKPDDPNLADDIALSPGLFLAKDVCKISNDGSKVYITYGGNLHTLLISKK